MKKLLLSENLKNPSVSLFYNSVLDSMNEGILFLDEKGILIKINKKGLNVFKLSQTEAFDILLAPQDHFQVYDLNHNKISEENLPSSRLKNKESFQNEQFIVILPAKGVKVYLSCSGFPQLDERGNFIGGFILFNDVTELVQTEKKLINEVVKNNVLAVEIENYQQKLNHDKQLLQAIIDTIPVMISISGNEENSIILNKAVENITGWTAADISNSSIMELAYPEPAYRKEVSDYMASFVPGFKDLVMRTKDGRDIDTSWANIQIPDGRRVGVGIDISERKKLEQELIKAKEKDETENQIQYAFIQNISHEVRTPMNSILGYTELLYSRVSSEEEFEFLDAISYNGSQLLRLINDIIDFSRLDKNELTINKEHISICKLMEMIRQQILGLEKHYKKTIKIQILNPLEGNEDFVLHTDIFRFQQIFNNLMSNAFNYTSQGHIKIGYNILSSSNNILFFVEDTGIGIPKENHNKIFDRQLHGFNKDIIQGSGLGLAICKSLVNLLGGEISLESEPGKGSTFFFTHPYIVVAPEPNIGSNESSVSETSEMKITVPLLENQTILIVEDDTFSYNMMKHMLLATHATILHADTGTKALEMVRNYNIDFVFLDIHIPEMNGFSVISHIRQFNKHLPVVAQTANALMEDKIKTKNAGFNAHITKPFTQKTLFSVINQHMFAEKSDSELV